ncbi:FAD-binding oxidoreductase [Ramlibacter tataouinensis]|uniref:FAD-linked oxidase n=1 Tax=Ramlibacter tataouinensis TaxID=94132 RepID=A0A127JZC8_9BURK|nr:FAD-binding protein [Ramlibacter tataouinensis]AMO25284.1 FAD-linked oxidase [Ramlibacter tataouinensis]
MKPDHAASRRRVLQAGLAVPLTATLPRLTRAGAAPGARVRPSDAAWPAADIWKALAGQLAGSLVAVRSPWTECVRAPAAKACAEVFKQAKNPYFLGDEVALTQTLGWVDAWTSAPSAYAVRARNTADVVTAVNFARNHNLRLVVKGGGHSYQGTSNAPDSLLVWTRDMKDVTLHENWVPRGCEDRMAPARAASIGAGALWAHAYDAVTTRGGGYVQGGGCMTVGVAGLVQSGGFGSFSKAFGLAASSLLEAEVVTADGRARIVNACTNPELFWGLKGGGGSSLGVVTRLTLRVHALPETFGAVNFTVRAKSDAAFRKLIALVTRFYADQLMNPHWGEQIRFRPGNVLVVSMVFQGIERAQAQATWAPFFAQVEGQEQDFSIDFSPLKVVATSARTFWSPTLLKRTLGFIRRDDRPGAPEGNVFWPGDQGQAGQVLHGYQSTWLPAALLQPARHGALCDALFAATRHWGLSLHVNKGLAGAPAEAVAAARDTAMNPAVLDAFALAISGAEEQPAYPGVAGHEPNVALARQRARSIVNAMGALRALVPRWGSYVSESDYFEPDWQQAFWGANYERLAAVKQQYDPDGLFFVHHGVGSEKWSADGFTRLRA